jgi:hypothetical protein
VVVEKMIDGEEARGISDTMNSSSSRSESSRKWHSAHSAKMMVVLLLLLSGGVVVIISSCCFVQLSSPAETAHSLAAQEHLMMQRRRLATKDANNDDTSTRSQTQQMSTISITSKLNEKRSFLDPSWKEWGDALVQFETLVSPSELDFTISRRLPWEQDDSPEKCDDILLLMPEYFARNGHGSQLNSYLLAAMMATFLGKAMLILDAPQKNTKYPNGSMVSV